MTWRQRLGRTTTIQYLRVGYQSSNIILLEMMVVSKSPQTKHPIWITQIIVNPDGLGSYLHSDCLPGLLLNQSLSDELFRLSRLCLESRKAFMIYQIGSDSTIQRITAGDSLDSVMLARTSNAHVLVHYGPYFV